MSVVTFWSNGKEQTGKTLSIAAIATHMAIEHNYKILVVSTGYKDTKMDNCFWNTDTKKKKNLGLFGPNTSVPLSEGINGLARIMKSNKLSPEMITNYTKIVFKERLEIIQTFKGSKGEYDDIKKVYPDIIALANKFYDIVLVDLDNELNENDRNEILRSSNLIVANLSQRLTCINEFLEKREQTPILKSQKTLILISRYDKFSKYSIKNISRYMKEKNIVSTIPYNTLFFEAAEEAGVSDLFLRLRRINEDDRNGFFLAEVKRASENITYRLQDLQLK